VRYHLPRMQNLLSNTLAFAFALGVIIFVHEFGHLLVAKAFGTRVDTFSLGFGKRLWGFRRGDTDYRLSLIPLGGYVKLGGEDAESATGDPREFQSKPRWQRVLVYLAGPAMNILLAILLIAIVFMVGIEVPDLQNIPATVGSVEADSSAAAAGIQPGDQITAVAGKAVERWQDVGFALMTSPGKPVALSLRRGEATLEVEVTPVPIPKYEVGDTAGIYPIVRPRITQVLPGGAGESAGLLHGDEIWTVDGQVVADPASFVGMIEARPGVEVTLGLRRAEQETTIRVVPRADDSGKGKIGVRLGVFQRYGPARAFVESARYNWNVTRQTLSVLGKIITRDVPAKSALSGPIEIAALSGAAARSGVKNLIYLMGFISISIAILNLLPVPILDGGQIAMLAIEGTLRRDLSLTIKERINQVGFVLLMGLMVTVLWFDLAKNLPFLSDKTP
jgi:regulator of sigma E protease